MILIFTNDIIEEYLRKKEKQGVKATAIKKYNGALLNLSNWLGDNREVSSERLLEWKEYLNNCGYSKITVQKHITVINSFLRLQGYDSLCIPKPKRLDLTNKKFGYLTAIEPTDKRDSKGVIWTCVCKCGKEVEVSATNLKNMNTTSCGCLKSEVLKFNNRYVEGTELRQSLNDNPISKRSKSGFVGVCAKRDKWVAYIQYKGVRYNLGTFYKIEDAVKARARAKELVKQDALQLYEETKHLFSDIPCRPSYKKA